MADQPNPTSTAATAPPPPNNSPLHQAVAPPGPGSAQPADGRPSSPAPQQQRAGAIADAAYDHLTVDQQSGYSRLRDPEGNPQWVKRDQIAADSGITKPPGDAPPATTAPTDKVKIGDMEVSQAELQEFFKSKGEAELRKASLPASADDYKTDLPANFELPAGVKDFTINESDPLLTDARKLAHAKGFDQATFSEMVGLYAGAKAKEVGELNTALAAEVAKLGVNGTARVDSLSTWIRGVVGDKLAKPMQHMLCTADIVRGLEIIQSKFSSQGAASFSQAHREPPAVPGRVSEAEYATMTPAARLDYARSHDQSQFQQQRVR